MQDSGSGGFIVGLSGGLDSAVTALLCKLAAGKRTLALILPCHSQRKDVEDAKRVSRKFKMRTKQIDLSGVYNTLARILPSSNMVTQGNFKARLRMSVLYYFANKYNYLVVGTGNKSELKMGYFTKFGDGGCDLLPIGDLLKTEVRQLAYDLNIPQDIINKAPSAGLWQGQTDEAELGISYSELDDILERLENKKKQIISQNKVNKVKAKIKQTEHKRQGPKMCHL